MCVSVLNDGPQWWVHANLRTGLHMRANDIYMSSDDIKETGYTYILPKNVLKKFVTISDVGTQVCLFMHSLIHPFIRPVICVSV